MNGYTGLLPPDLLDTCRNAMVPKIRLSEFASNFWLAFTGRIEDPERAREVLAYWVQHVAGNASRAVDVVDDVNGTHIARIPPVLTSGHTSNLVELFKEIHSAREQSKFDNEMVAAQRLQITKEAIMKKYDNSYLKDSVEDWMTLYQKIEGEVPSTEVVLGDPGDLGVISDETLNNLEWE